MTNGPFLLDTWEHNSRIDLAKWDEWRNAADVALERVNGRMISEGTTAVQAFEAGEVDETGALGGLPPEEMPRLKEMPQYEQTPSLATYYYGVNVDNIPDVNQRRAMALAIDRRSIIDNIAQADQLPASGMTPSGMPGFDTINPASEFLPETADVERAKELMSQVSEPGDRHHARDQRCARPSRDRGRGAGRCGRSSGSTPRSSSRSGRSSSSSLGPPPEKTTDTYRLGWVGDFVDAINFLELWTCDSGNNSTNYCNEEYDALVEEARATPDDAERWELYAQMEEMLFGPEGDMPILPIYFYTNVSLQADSIRETFNQNLLDQIDLTKVVEGDGGDENV